MTAQQLTLIAEPRARHDNPVTSVLAAKAMRPGAGDLEAAIVETVRAARRPLCAEAIAESVFAEHHGRWKLSTIDTRVSQVANNGLIHPAGYGLTSRNRTAVTYRSAP